MADWTKISSRGKVADRRGTQTFGLAGSGVGLAVFAVVTLVSLFSGGKVNIDPGAILTGLQQVQTSSSEQSPEFAGDDSYETFASTVLGSNNDIWRDIFNQKQKTYSEPTLVLFRSFTASGCGYAASQVGPHYCPIDSTIYLDETFFEELTRRFGAKGGDVAQAYVIAHEVGHHVQSQLGIMDQVNIEQQDNPSKANELSVQLELQADCFAGVWAHSLKDTGVFEAGEINEAIDAAAAVGDDRIQQQTQGYQSPESWTHGSSEERMEWFSRGYETGQPSACNTF